MSHFYASITGTNRKPRSLCATKNQSLVTHTQGKDIGVKVHIHHSEGKDIISVYRTNGREQTTVALVTTIVE